MGKKYLFWIFIALIFLSKAAYAFTREEILKKQEDQVQLCADQRDKCLNGRNANVSVCMNDYRKCVNGARGIVSAPPKKAQQKPRVLVSH
jgi:hypothetical protein